MASSLLAEVAEHSEKGSTPCLVCSGELLLKVGNLFDTRFGIPGKYSIGACLSCGLEQLVPRPKVTQLRELYESYYNFGGEKGTGYTKFRERLFSSFLYRAWMRLDGDISFHNRRGGRGCLLDVGCNEGRGLEIYQRNGFNVEGLELNERSAEVARQKGFTIHTESLECFEPFAPYDIAVLSNVLEHSLDPRAMLAGAMRVLKPGGKIWISCPNSRSWLRSVFGRYWINWHVPFHIVFFSPESLSRLLTKLGCENVVVSQITPSLWFASSVVACLSAREGRKTALLRSAWLMPMLVLLVRGLFFPFLFVGNRLGRGDCLIVTATRPCSNR